MIEDKRKEEGMGALAREEEQVQWSVRGPIKNQILQEHQIKWDLSDIK